MSKRSNKICLQWLQLTMPHQLLKVSLHKVHLIFLFIQARGCQGAEIGLNAYALLCVYSAMQLTASHELLNHIVHVYVGHKQRAGAEE